MARQADNSQSPSEMMLIGARISEALGVFTQDFLPHMQEEEELFQPLLMEYFTYEELKRIRYEVIEKHVLHTKYCSDDDKQNVKCEALAEKFDELKADEIDPTRCKINALPAELMLTVFSYLSPRDLCRTAQISAQWNRLSMDASLWSSLRPVRWAQGDWRFTAEESQLPDFDRQDDDSCITVDEDADFDESESSAESDGNSHELSRTANGIRRQARMLDGIAKYLIPVVGPGVRTLDLAQSRGLNNAVMYRLLVHTPNLEYLNLSLAKVSDIAFKGFGKNGSGSQLKHLNLSGCTGITDATIKRLANAIKPQQSNALRTKRPPSCKRDKASDGDFVLDKNGRAKVRIGETYDTPSTERGQCHAKRNVICDEATHGQTDSGWIGELCEDCATSFTGETGSLSNVNASQLEFLSLAGCYKITDEGLGYLSDIGGLPSLVHLDLSGCLHVTSAGLNRLAMACHQLDHQEFYYCDNIQHGPYEATASGCQNLQCGYLVCCRSGE